MRDPHFDRTTLRVPYDPERDLAAASYRTKQVILLATDELLDRIALDELGDPAIVQRLISDRVLPRCYLDRYDEPFLKEFRVVIELTRNLLVSDAPFLPDVASEVAAHAIFREAERVLAWGPNRCRAQAAAVDSGLPIQLARNSEHLARELELLRDSVLEDWDALLLFELPASEDPVADLHARLRPEERAALRFENWRVPFGAVPRPHITYDGRAWPVAL
jgi:hypothetical protein